MHQQTYFLQQMGITVWKSNLIENQSCVDFNSSLLIVSNLSHLDIAKQDVLHNTLINNIAKAMQLPELKWLQINYSDFCRLYENTEFNQNNSPQWLWLLGLSEQENITLKDKLRQEPSPLRIVSSCGLGLLSNDKSEKALLWQQISKLLK